LTGCTDEADPTGSGSPVVDFLFADNVGTSRPLPGKTFNEAFETGRTVLAQRYTVASMDTTTGVIRCEPELTGQSHDRVVGTALTRRIATMRIRRRGNTVRAIVSVAVQRQGSPIYRQFTVNQENYDSVPNKTPAETEAATTPDQNDAWETKSYDHAQENEILNDLERALERAEGQAERRLVPRG